MGNYEISYVLVKDRYRFDKQLLVETGEFEGRDIVDSGNVDVSDSDWNGEFVGKLLYEIVRKYVSNEEDALSMIGTVFEIEQYEDQNDRFVPNGEDYLTDVEILAVYGLNVSVCRDGVVVAEVDASRVPSVLAELRLEDTEYVVSFFASDVEPKLDVT